MKEFASREVIPIFEQNRRQKDEYDHISDKSLIGGGILVEEVSEDVDEESKNDAQTDSYSSLLEVVELYLTMDTFLWAKN